MDVITDLYNEGLRTLQFDDCTWGALADDGFVKRFNADRPLEEVRRDFAGRALLLNNSVLDLLQKDLVVNHTFAVVTSTLHGFSQGDTKSRR